MTAINDVVLSYRKVLELYFLAVFVDNYTIIGKDLCLMIVILPTKITAAQKEVPLIYSRVRGLHLVTVIFASSLNIHLRELLLRIGIKEAGAL